MQRFFLCSTLFEQINTTMRTVWWWQLFYHIWMDDEWHSHSTCKPDKPSCMHAYLHSLWNSLTTTTNVHKHPICSCFIWFASEKSYMTVKRCERWCTGKCERYAASIPTGLFCAMQKERLHSNEWIANKNPSTKWTQQMCEENNATVRLGAWGKDEFEKMGVGNIR